MENEEKIIDLEWSLNPINNIVKICGIPAFCGSNSVFKLVQHSIFGISLCINLFCSLYCMITECTSWISTVSQSWHYDEILTVPHIVFEFLKLVFENIFVVSIPLIFAAQFYFTERWQEVKNCIQIIHQEMEFTRKFYQRCRRSCILCILLFLLVIQLINILLKLINVSTSYHY